MSAALDAGFWRGRRVFVTGHTGFKGAWLALWLHRLGAVVSGYALAPATRPSLFALARLHEWVESTTGDVRDAGALAAALARARPEVVFHLAAQALVRPSYVDPVGTYATNVMGTVHLLEAVRRSGGTRALVCVTSDKCYAPRADDRAHEEGDAMGGHDPYSASKGCAELVAGSYRDAYFPAAGYRRHGLALATARAGNVIGGGDWSPERLLPDLFAAADTGHRVQIRRPDAIRPWQHVLDALHGYLLLAQRLSEQGPAWAGAWNFGPDPVDARSVREVAELLGRHLPLACVFASAPEGPHESASLRLDSTRARRLLGWRPHWDVEQAIVETAHWHLAHRHGADARAVCIEQIDRHQRASHQEGSRWAA